MKSIYERIKNNIRPILQLLLLVGVFFAPRIFKITELIKTPPKLEASQKICDYIFYFAWKGGDWAIGVFFLIVVLFIIRKWNKTYMFNRGNYYKQYRYGWYRICSKILGYSECNLIQVPIYMQFKLVLNDTFDKYNCGEFDKKENDTISVSKSNFSHETDEVNVMISDTYPLSLSQLPEIKKNIPTSFLIQKKTKSGYVLVSSPELTAMDLILYDKEIGGINRAATVLNELAEELNFRDMAISIFDNTPVPVVQRLGYLLEELDYSELADDLLRKTKEAGILFRKSPLKTGKDSEDCEYNAKWKIIINEEIEIDE